MTTRTKIFIAYARADQAHVEALLKHLAPLIDAEEIEVWYDGDVIAGEEWESKIDTRLRQSDIVVFLVTSDSIASKYFDGEFEIALERHEQGEAILIPVILRPCVWKSYKRLRGKDISNFQVLPKDGKAITEWNNIDLAYSNVVEGLERTVKSLQQNRDDEKAWRKACSQHSIEGYKSYLALYHHHEEDAQKRINDLQHKTDIDEHNKADNKAWLAAHAAHNIEAYQSYLAVYSNHASEARKHIAELKAVAEADEKAWKLAHQENTISGYRQYLRGYRKYAAEANAAIKQLEQAETADNNAWLLATQANTVTAYKNYLKTYSLRTLEAQQRKLELEKTIADNRNKIFTNLPWRNITKGTAALLLLLSVAWGGKKLMGYKQPSSQPALDTTITDIQDKPIVANVTAYTETIGSVSFKMKRIPAGSFTMGSNDGQTNEKPTHSVILSAFNMMETEVTQALWREVIGSDPPDLRNKGCDECPVENVSWHDAQEFIKKLKDRTGKTYRLPTEAEWEYAACGGLPPFGEGGYKYAGSNNITDVAWYSGNYKNIKDSTHPIKTKQTNGYGLYDMSGNVYEWCQDWYDEKFYSKPAAKNNNPVNNVKSGYRVLRGGSWDHDARDCRTSYREYSTPTDGNDIIGFRLVLPQ